MGPGWPPRRPEYARWGKTLRDELEGKPNDDQSALVYLLSRHSERERWANYFQGYWAEIVDWLDAVARRYEAVERGRAGSDGGGHKGRRGPFTGCQPCGGAPIWMYTRRRSAEGIRRALAFSPSRTTDQVLRAARSGSVTPLSDSVTPLALFDYPAAQ